MAKWSVAIRAIDTPRYYLRRTEDGRTVSWHQEEPRDFDEKLFFVHECIGWEKRLEFGDIVAFKPYEMTGRMPHYSARHRWGHDVWTEQERKTYTIVTLDGLELEQMFALCEAYYDTSIIISDKEEGFPDEYFKKRRFKLLEEDLDVLGADIARMKNKEDAYMPSMRDIVKEDNWDKLRLRKVASTDNLRPIDPLPTTIRRVMEK